MDPLLIYIWNLQESSENFDACMKNIGVNYINRKIEIYVQPSVQIVKRSENDYSLKTFSKFRDTELKFKINQEVDEITIDGRYVKTVFSLDGKKLVQTQKETLNGKITKTVREIKGDEMITTCCCDGLESVRVYLRAH